MHTQLKFKTIGEYGSDYNAASSVERTFTPGSKNGATKCINITILEDIVTEEDENFTIILTSSDAHALIQGDITLVKILDNDGTYYFKIVFFFNHVVLQER